MPPGIIFDVFAIFRTTQCAVYTNSVDCILMLGSEKRQYIMCGVGGCV